MDDITNGGKRSLKEVLPNKHIVDNASPKRDIKPAFTVPEPQPITNRIPRRAGPPVKTIIGVFVLVLLVVAGIVVTTSFSKATITVTPRLADIVLEDSTTHEAKSTPSEDFDLVFGTVTKNLTESKTVTASGEKDVAEKAQGTIIVYNTFTDKPMNLIANTRFETKDGKIYRISKAVVVPAMKGSTPGSMEAVVTADKAGAEYNTGLTDFTLPGLKTDQVAYTKVYARSKTAMTGGFLGKTKVVAETDRKNAETELRAKLGEQAGVALDVPAGQILVPDSIVSSFSPLRVEAASSSNQATVSLSMTYTGVLLKQTDLARFLAQKYVPEYKNEPVDILAMDAIKITLRNKDQLTATNLTNVAFSLAGKARLVWTFDELKLKESLKGLSKSTYSTKLVDFPAIQKASVSFRPPWIFTIPDNLEKIEVKQEVAL